MGCRKETNTCKNDIGSRKENNDEGMGADRNADRLRLRLQEELIDRSY